MMAKTDARWLRRKNTKALRVAIEQSELEATTEVAAKEKAPRMTKAQERASCP